MTLSDDALNAPLSGASGLGVLATGLFKPHAAVARIKKSVCKKT
jgi:hypothetical protein